MIIAKGLTGVDKALAKMKSVRGTDKGIYGEEAVFSICEDFYRERGGILYHSYEYKTVPSKVGNIKRNESGQHYFEKLSNKTEIDILYVSPCYVYVIEVKAYKSNKLKLDDAGIYGCLVTNKSPVHQNEMHTRHLYPQIARVLPHGETEYIKQIVVFVDAASITDARSNMQKEYIKVTILDRLRQVINEFDQPRSCRLNLQAIDRVLNECKVSSDKYLPVRDLNG